MTENPQVTELVNAIVSDLDTMTGKYDGRVLAAALAMRAAKLWNGLRQAGYETPENIAAMIAIVQEDAFDDSLPPQEIRDEALDARVLN